MNKDKFFVIDSKSIDLVKDGLYGFVVSPAGIFDSDNFSELNDEYVTGNGTYILIKNYADRILITQDFNGSWGIYYYRSDNYFALSNSITLLADYLKENHKLSLDRDYANDFLMNPLASRTITDTVISEIKLLERHKKAVIYRDGRLEFECIDYKENTVSLYSEDALHILDGWFEKWAAIARGLERSDAQLLADLTGGFDSRTALSLLIASGVDLKKISFNSFRRKAYTYVEDYDIASGIADDFGFKLNDRDILSDDAYYYSDEEVLENAFYTRFTVHKEFFFEDRKYIVKRYKFTGDGGESIKGKHMYNRKSFIDMECGQAKRFSDDTADELCGSVLKILDGIYDYIGEYYGISPDPEDGILGHRETWNRSHFGKNAVESYLNNTYRLQPLIDPDLYRIIPDIGGSDDKNLLLALIFVRFCPELLEYEFQGGRKLDKDTIEQAKRISDKNRFVPRSGKECHFSISTEDHKLEEQIRDRGRKEGVKDLVKRRLFRVFESDGMVKQIFCSRFSEEIYRYARFFLETDDYVPLRMFSGILAVVWAIKQEEYSLLSADRSLSNRLTLLGKEKNLRGGGLREYGFPYCRIKKGSSIVLYGAGAVGSIYKKQIDLSGYCRISHWVDRRNMEIGNGTEDIDVISDGDFDYVVIAIRNENIRNEVAEDLIRLGVDKGKIIR